MSQHRTLNSGILGDHYGQHGVYQSTGGIYGTGDGYGYTPDWEGLTLAEVGRVAARQFTVAPYLTIAGGLAGIYLLQQADKLIKQPPKARKPLTDAQKLGVVLGTVTLANLAHILGSLAVAARD